MPLKQETHGLVAWHMYIQCGPHMIKKSYIHIVYQRKHVWYWDWDLYISPEAPTPSPWQPMQDEVISDLVATMGFNVDPEAWLVFGIARSVIYTCRLNLYMLSMGDIHNQLT